jgi:hypothetical protein
VDLSLGGLASAKLSGDETGVGGVIILGHGGKIEFDIDNKYFKGAIKHPRISSIPQIWVTIFGYLLILPLF